MIKRLEVKSLALFDSLSIDFGNGLSVFTGETGAGKSLLISALDLAVGASASREQIRTGEENALIEADFSNTDTLLPDEKFEELLQDGLINEEEPGRLILSRELSEKGRHSCRINGRAQMLKRIREISSYLIEIQSQRDQAALYDEKNHIEFLDRFGGEKISFALKAYKKLLSERKSLLIEAKKSGGLKNERERRLDILNFQIEEINEADLHKNEDIELREKRRLAAESEKVFRSAEEASLIFDSGEGYGTVSEIKKLRGILRKLSEISSGFDEAYEKSDVVLDLISDINAEIRRESEKFSYDEGELTAIDARLDLISKLKRKYGPELSDVITFKSTAEKEREELINAGRRLSQIETLLSENAPKIKKAADLLSSERQAAAKILENGVVREIRSLGMSKAWFRVDIKKRKKLGNDGADEVCFMLESNEGEGFKPLGKTASGGEQARLLFAVQIVLYKDFPSLTMVFDEIDTGISGKTSRLIAEKLKKLSENKQVFCVTHSAQIAAAGDRHYFIQKESKDGRTSTRILELSMEDRKKELARLLSGHPEDMTSVQLAEKMLRTADF